MSVPFIDLQAEYRQLQPEIDAAVAQVLRSGWYILGQEVAQFEEEFAAYCGVPYAVGVASGTDALLLALRALDVGPGDEVITVAHTAVATVAAVELSGARPVLVDIDPISYTLDPVQIEAALTDQTRVIIPVHLYGQAANMAEILETARRHGLLVIEDCAQAHGTRYRGQRVGSFGDAAAFSFYPTKNLGAMGDGGAVVTANPETADRVRLLQQYGWRQRYVSDIAGYNSRLDELQAALLRVKLRHLEDSNRARQRLAQQYQALLAGLPLTLPAAPSTDEHVYHLFVIQTEQRDALQAYLRQQGIGTAVHYPVPVHRQPAYHRLGYHAGHLPVTERVSGRILSLPMHPYLAKHQIETVTKAISAFFDT